MRGAAFAACYRFNAIVQEVQLPRRFTAKPDMRPVYDEPEFISAMSGGSIAAGMTATPPI